MRIFEACIECFASVGMFEGPVFAMSMRLIVLWSLFGFVILSGCSDDKPSSSGGDGNRSLGDMLVVKPMSDPTHRSLPIAMRVRLEFAASRKMGAASPARMSQPALPGRVRQV